MMLTRGLTQFAAATGHREELCAGLHSATMAVLALPMHAVRLGPLRLSPYGLCAVVGILAAMALSAPAARRSGADPQSAWDAGLFAVLSCFVASRLLLVVSDPKAFLHYPALVLSLPSLTIAGLGLAALMTFVYVRRKRYALLPLLDAFAPCSALLAACLELGHWLEASEPGMPVFQRGAKTLVGFTPVSLYGVLGAVLLAAGLWSLLNRCRFAGQVAALGLMLGGALAFGLDMLSLPVDLFGDWWLEPGQLVALGAMLAGAAVWSSAPRAPEFTTPGRPGSGEAHVDVSGAAEPRTESFPFATTSGRSIAGQETH